MIDVVSGIIEGECGLLLLAQRPEGKRLQGYWEFPGGKIEPGESAEQALVRELKEELLLRVQVRESLGVFPYEYDWGSIALHVYTVLPLNLPSATQDVQVFRWCLPQTIDQELLAPADIEPLRVYLSRLAAK